MKHTQQSGHKVLGCTINPNQHLRCVKGFSKCVPRLLIDDQKRTQLNISKYLLTRCEDDPGDFIEQVETQDET